MKTTETTVTPTINENLELKNTTLKNDGINASTSIVNVSRVKSLRPMKSMVRVKSFTPQRMSGGLKARKRTVKI